ncbi:MAG: lysozyme [Acidobacteriaceae bacterium]|nr:lysozyme [Acidobacteriaceae bacterium]
MEQYRYSTAGLTLTKDFEGLRLEAYKDAAGVWTIGYGHTGDEVRQGQRITPQQAEALLQTDLQAAVFCVQRVVTAPLTQGQFDALVDFCFNAGQGALERSTLLAKVNRLEFEEAATEFARWDKSGGKRCPGLSRRRAAEATLFRNTQSATVSA